MGQLTSNQATILINIKAVNDAPVPKDDFVSVDEDNSVIITPLFNDFDIDGYSVLNYL